MSSTARTDDCESATVDRADRCRRFGHDRLHFYHGRRRPPRRGVATKHSIGCRGLGSFHRLLRWILVVMLLMGGVEGAGVGTGENEVQDLGLRFEGVMRVDVDGLVKRSTFGNLVVAPGFAPPRNPGRIDRRADENLPSSITNPTASSTASSAKSSQTGLATADDGEDEDEMPTPFDSVSLTSNFTAETCPQFLKGMKADPEFQKCLPLSTLLQNSNSFFQIERQGAFAVSKVLDATCDVNVTQCTNVMETYGWKILTDGACGADYERQNQVVVQAYKSLVAYRSVYLAGCLKSDEGSYCFSDAVTNTKSPADLYVYYLALGSFLPSDIDPSCNTCLDQTMDVFEKEAGNSTLPISETYVKAAETINLSCGPSFSNTTVVPLESSAVVHNAINLLPSVLVAIVALVLLF